MRTFTVCAVATLLLVGSTSVFAQSDAEKFAEGRAALDKYKDCRGAKEALESVSEAGRSEALWIQYAAKAYECLGELESALPLYVKYNELVGNRTDLLDKIGDIRYRISAKRRTEEADRLRKQQAEEAEKARQRKEADDRRALDLEKQEARARLENVLQTLNVEIETSWKVLDSNGETTTSVAKLPQPTCQFRFILRQERHQVFLLGTKDQRDSYQTRTDTVTVDLTGIKRITIGESSLTLGAERDDPVVKGSWEYVSKWIDRGKRPSENIRNGSLLEIDFGVPFGWPRANSYTLPLEENRSRESSARLKQAFDVATETCKKAGE